MSDVAKVKKALQGAQGQIDAGLKALQNDNVKTALEERPSFEILRKDFISVVSLIHSYSTRLWIALGKQPPTPSAAWPTLEELSKHVYSLYGCSIAFKESNKPLCTAEVRTAATEVLLALQGLLQDYSSGMNGGDAMRKTAALHEACDNARNISVDDREAALKVWKQDGEVVKDAIKELTELLSSPKSDVDADELSDGWDELLGEDIEAAELSEDERTTAKKVLVALEKVSALRKYVQKSILGDRSRVQETSWLYQPILEASKVITSNVDDVVACLCPPLELEELRRLLARLSGSLHSLVAACSGSADGVLDSMALLNLSDDPSTAAQSPSMSPLAVKADDIANAIQAI